MIGRRLISGRQALGVEIDLRNGLYARLVRLSFGFYDRHQTGQLMSPGDGRPAGRPLLPRLRPDLPVPERPHRATVTVVLFFVEWRLALIALAVVPVLVALAYRYSHVSHPTLREVQQKLADVATVAQENIVGVHVVKAFAQEPAEQAKFDAPLRGASSGRRWPANRQRALYVPLISFVPLLAQAARAARRRADGLGRQPHGRQLRRLQPLPRHAGRRRCARSGCGSGRRSGRPRPASASSRSWTSRRRSPTAPARSSCRRARARSASRACRSRTWPDRPVLHGSRPRRPRRAGPSR